MRGDEFNGRTGKFIQIRDHVIFSFVIKNGLYFYLSCANICVDDLRSITFNINRIVHMLKLKPILTLGVILTALAVSACSKKESENETKTQETTAPASSQQVVEHDEQSVISTAASMTPADQVDAAP